MVDFTKLANRAAEGGKDMTVAQKGGGDFKREVPAAGPCRLRFIAYVELGKQDDQYMGKPTQKEKVILVFEASGPRHPAFEGANGEKMPHRITIEENLSLNEKAHFFKLFTRMNYAGKSKHMVGLLGSPYKGVVIHRKYKRKGDPAEESGWTGVAVELFDKKTGQYTIEAPRYEVVNEEGPTGEFKELPVAPALSDLRAFVWAYADKAQWDSLYIAGEYPVREDDKTGAVTAPAKSKNVFQSRIRQAVNFKGSPIDILLAGGAALDLGVAPEKAVPGDALNTLAPAGAAMDFDDDIPF
jgi:hypothetical protein